MAGILHFPDQQTPCFFNPLCSPILNSNILFTLWPIAPASRRLVLLLFLLGLGRVLTAQCTLACNEGLQVSLNASGHALITTQLIAPNAGNSCPGALELTLFNNIGQILPNPLTCANIGQTVTARVRHVATGNFCTSDLTVLDAIAPTISCPDKFVFCHQNTEPSDVGMPTATDNCTASNLLDFNSFDTETNLGCGVFQNGVPVLKRIDRNWTVTDEHGNTSACTQKIWLKHIQVSDITYPPNHDNISAPALVCGDDPEDLNLTGEPLVAGIPVGASIDCEIAVAFTDQKINHCLPAAYTVVRNWTTINFCTGTVSSRVQIIKVEDKIAPIITAPEDVTVGTDGFTCTGSLTLPLASATDNCSAVSIVPSWLFGSGYGPFSSIPEGAHVVTYTATDACGNSATATMQVMVADASPPQAICNASLQLSLSGSGGAYLNAGTIGINSYDNCGPVVLHVSRDAENYAPQLLFSCDDIGVPVVITLRVTDAVGLENFCETEISVRDFLKPNIQCPASVSLTCLQDHRNVALTGQATATDNCVLDSIFYQDIATLNACNIGTVNRTWKAIDAAGNLKTCSQNITLSAVNTTSVAFPLGFLVNGCSTPDAIHPDVTGWPVLGGQGCSALSINYTDHVFSGAPPFCRRILRDWTVVDHCIYDLNGGTAGIWEQTQIIDIIDNTAPLLVLPTDITVAGDQSDCSANVLISDAIGSDCNAPVAVSNNSAFANAADSNASGNYPLGVHVVTFTASDACGNISSQTLTIRVEDHLPPTAVCQSGVVVNISANSTALLLPQAFNAGSSDGCSLQSSLQFSISPTMVNCQTLGLQLVVLQVSDPAGNTAQCSTFVQVTDDAQVCGIGAAGFSIDGTIRTPTGLVLRNIPVQLTGNGVDETLDCDTLGFFAFQDVPQGDTVRLRPQNNANWLNGVTTFDLVLISKHILGITPLSSPLKMIAADANRSNSITTFDIVQLRKVLLGILDTVPGNTSWRFIDSTFVFQDTLNPFSAPIREEIVFNNLNSNQVGKSFIAQKIGDVNDSTDPVNARSPQDTLPLNLGNTKWYAGEKVAIPVYLPDWDKLEGFQFELEFDAKQVLVERVDFPAPTVLNGKNIALKNGQQLAVSWDNAAQRGDHRQPLFILHLSGITAGDVFSSVKIKRDRLSPEAYAIENEGVSAIFLQGNHTDAVSQHGSLRLYPNPTTGTFQLDNPLQGAAERLRILDGMGRVVWTQSGKFDNTITVSGNDFLPGIYLIELTGNNGQRVAGKLVKQ